MDKTQIMLALVAVMLSLLVSTSQGLQCYQCRSDNDPACADPFDEESDTVKAFKKDCPADKNSYCRKIGQSIQGFYSVVRQCGDEETNMSCRERVGSKGIKMNYCACDKDNCNGSSQVKSTGVFLQAVATLILAYFMRNAF